MMTRIGGTVAALIVVCSSAQSQTKLDPAPTTIASTIAARDKAGAGIWYAKFEIEHEGPAYLFDMPEAEYGQQYRYRYTEEWWTDGVQCAVAVGPTVERFLNDQPLASEFVSDQPLYAYVKNKTAVSFVDLEMPGRKLVVNSTWPYENAAIPILFGRAFSAHRYADVATSDARIVRREPHLGNDCSVLAWQDNRLSIESWLGEKLDFMCVREMARLNDVLVLDRVYDIQTSARGRRYPASAMERFVTSDGSETIKSWRLLALDESPTLPFFVFDPKFDDAALVMDGATGKVLKSPDREGDGAR